MIWFIYNYLLLIVLLLGLPFFLFRLATTRRFRRGLGERFTWYGRREDELQSGRSIWIQAASVGEVSACRPLIQLLRKEFPDHRLVLTCQTASGRRVGRDKLPREVSVLLCPLDMGFLVERFIRLISPKILILIETELWPGLITVCRKRKIPVVVVSGRISPRAFQGYLKARFLLEPLLKKISVFNMRTEEDADRIRRLGAPPARVFITGNIKFDSLPATDIPPATRRELMRQLGLKPGDMLVIGGSTFEGEEAILHRAFRGILSRFSGLRLLLAPRHLERVGEIEDRLKSRNQPYSLFTRLVTGEADKKARVVILDEMGVLFTLYSLATVVFVGRSLRGEGGQNPIEPASWGKPLLFGPHMENFRDIAAELVAAGGAIRLADDSGLETSLVDILSHPEKRTAMGGAARRVVENRRGASRRNLETVKTLLIKFFAEKF